MESIDSYDVAADSIRKAAKSKLGQGLTQSALIPLQGNDQTRRVVEDWLAVRSRGQPQP